MKSRRDFELRFLAVAIWCLAMLAAPHSPAATTATFTADETGTFPGTIKLDRPSQVLTVDLGSLPKDATIFRAELILNPKARFQEIPVEPTTVHPVGQPEKKLAFNAPRCFGLDALDAVQAAVRSGEPLQLRLETTLRGVERLEVSFLEGKSRTRPPAVVGVEVRHRSGQSLVVFREPNFGGYPDFKTGADVARHKEQLLKDRPGLRYRIWRSPERITPATIVKARLVGECGPLTGWNDTYHQGRTNEKPPVRYRVDDGGEPVPWGTGIYAHNPTQAGEVYYAVTVAMDGEEDLDALGAGNTTAESVKETVGPGEPILQWVEQLDQEERWHYRHGELVRLVYTRWEVPPRASRASVPIDYLVVIPLTPLPSGELKEPQYKSYRVEPAPVGLHLHCWGGSLNGGYGWWYNGHRGSVLIASNQIPYDWWTGYHESRGTRKTFGDGVVRPFTMRRTFAFLDWAAQQHREAPKSVRRFWPELDLTRVFAAGNSMGGSGAPMFAIRYGDRIAWALGWVGVHVPELSPQFKSSYLLCYGPRDQAITMPDEKTSPWDYFSDVWWLKNNMARDTGLIIASNGKNDGGIGWKQAFRFARALQETRRPHLFNWDIQGHGTHTRIGANFDLDVRTDQTLPAFTNCSLDDNLGTGTRKTDEQIEAERQRQEAEIAAGKRKHVHLDPYDGDSRGQCNAYLWWHTDDVVDTDDAWEMTLLLKVGAPQDSCTVSLTPRRCQRFRPQAGEWLTWTNTSARGGGRIGSGEVVVDRWGLVTIERLVVDKGGNRIAVKRK